MCLVDKKTIYSQLPFLLRQAGLRTANRPERWDAFAVGCVCVWECDSRTPKGEMEPLEM